MKCRYCHGTGVDPIQTQYMVLTTVCSHCGGAGKVRSPFDVKEEIYIFLRDHGCDLREKDGILTVRTLEGVDWDMTIPQMKR